MPHHCHALLSICRVETSARVMTAASGLSGCNALEAASPAVAASITGRTPETCQEKPDEDEQRTTTIH